MDSPRYTVIVPMRNFRADEPVLASLRERIPSDGPAQILVAEGNHPARQRNEALAWAQGEIIVFLDNDCRLGPTYWSVLEEAFSRPEVEIVGGPALLRSDATGPERIFHALLTHPLVVGPLCSRYAARGEFRPATQMQLILCNLAARVSTFTKTGPLSHRLYPNEENEWLDRAQAAHGIWYDPRQQVFRPQRSSWIEMARMLVRYGMGRTRQLQVSGWKMSIHHILPLLWVVPILAIVLGPAYMISLVLLGLLVGIIAAATCNSHLTLGQRCVAALVAPLIPMFYTLGQILGWFTLFTPLPDASTPIGIYNEKGERLNPDG